MTFTDGNLLAPASDFTVSVTYTNSPNFVSGPTYSITQPGGVGTAFDVEVSGNIAEAGNYAATVTVTDIGGSTVTDSNTTINVADAPLTDTTTPGSTISTTEGTAFSSQVLMTFSDANPFATASDFNYLGGVVVNYTNVPDFVTGPNYSVQLVSTTATASNWEVLVSGTIAEAGNFAATVTITDIGGSTVSDSNTTIEVADAALTAGALTPPVATAGAPTGPVVLFNFTDANPFATASDYTATVTWGDGTSNTSADGSFTVAVIPNGSGGFEVVGSHTYQTFLNNATFTVSVADVGGATTSASDTTFSVADAALIATPLDLTPPVATEGAPFSNVVLFHFADANPFETVADFTATISWGDGTISTVTSTPTADGEIVAHTGGGFDVVGAHTYPEELTGATFGVSVADNDGSSVSESTTFNVADAALTGSGFAPPTATEGIAFGPAVLWKFTDADPNGTVSDYTATIMWGDGSSNSSSDGTGTVSVVVDPTTAGVFDVVGTHTYSEEATGLTFSINVADAGGSTITKSGTLSVADAPLTAVTLTPPAATEGLSTGPVVLFNFTDANPAATPADFTAMVNWGDGSSNTSADGSGTVSVVPDAVSGFDVVGSHTYLEEGTDSLSVSVTDHPSTTSASGIVTVADAALTAGALTPPVATAGTPTGPVTLFNFTDANPLATAEDYTATVNWGDGTSSSSDDGTFTVAVVSNHAGGFKVVGSHTYEAPLTGATFSVSILDAGGSTTSASDTSFSVADAALTSNPTDLTPPVATEGIPFSNVVLFHFADANPFETASDFTASVTWGDGLVESNDPNVTVMAHTGGGFDVVGSHTYAEEMTGATFSVSVTDGVNSTAQSDTTFSVADAPLSSTAADLTPPVATVGTPFSNVVLFKFTDANPNATTADYTATVNWGDGTSNTSADGTGTVSVVPDSVSGFDVIGSHNYSVQLTNANFTVSVVDHFAATSQTTNTFSVEDEPVDLLPATNITTNEGALLTTAVAQFTDPGGAQPVGNYTASINWGDGTAATPGLISVDSNGLFTVTGTHTYAEETAVGSTDPVTVTVLHSTAAAASAVTADVTVSEVAVVLNATPLSISGDEDVATGSVAVATFTDPAGAELTLGQPTAGEYSATINWGDGTGTDSNTTITWSAATKTFTVFGNHTYAEDGVYDVTVTVNHPVSGPTTTESARRPSPPSPTSS